MPNSPLIELKGARVELDNRVILRDLNWALHAGQHAAITGENGSGKSTFLRLIGGELWPRPFDARLYAFGDAPTRTPLLAREKMALLSPEKQEKYVRQSLVGAEGERGWQLSAREAVLSGWFDAELLHQTPDAAQCARADQLLAQFDLEHLAHRALDALSQGQLRRVLLARALVKRPQVLLLDEACSGLDNAARAQLLDHINALARSGQSTLVMTTHRADELVPAIESVWQMREQTIARAARPIAAAPASVVARPTARVDATQTPLIELDNASVFLGGTRIFGPLNWRWMAGQHWALTGENGSGKSTFLRLLRGQIAPAWGGSVQRFGSDKRRAVAEIGREIALLSAQTQARFAGAMPVEDAVGSGFLDAFELWRPLTSAERAAAVAALKWVEAHDLCGRTFGKLSYGQTRRVLLARALVTSPRVVLLDEALDGLDDATRARLLHKLGELARRGIYFAFASHHAADFPDWVTDELRFPLASAAA